MFATIFAVIPKLMGFFKILKKWPYTLCRGRRPPVSKSLGQHWNLVFWMFWSEIFCVFIWNFWWNFCQKFCKILFLSKFLFLTMVADVCFLGNLGKSICSFRTRGGSIWRRFLWEGMYFLTHKGIHVVNFTHGFLTLLYFFCILNWWSGLS